MLAALGALCSTLGSFLSPFLSQFLQALQDLFESH